MTDPNPESILDSVKKVLGFNPDYEAFDLDILMHINATFGSLQQLGVGGDTGFVISDNTTLWSQYCSQLLYLGMIKQYIFMSVKLVFDPPGTSFGIESVQKVIGELAWRINVAAEFITPPSPPVAVVTEDDQVSVLLFQVKAMTLTFASLITPDASLANTFYLTTTDDCTINPPVNAVDGEHITLEITSDSETVSWGDGWNFGDSGAPVLSGAGRTDIVSAVWRELSNDWLAGFTAGF